MARDCKGTVMPSRGKGPPALQSGVTDYCGGGLIAQGESGRQGASVTSKNSDFLLHFTAPFCILRAMSKLIVFIVGIVWASLLLVSWGGTTETPSALAETVALERSGN